ncbi:MAG: LysM peptidoglycan-binding domain-containing protein [Flavobacteriales bacterium]
MKQRNKSKSLVHKVKRGEVLGAIARKYETTVKKLIEWNNKNSEQIKPGEKIKIKNVDEELVKKINSEKSVRLSLTHKVKKGEVLLKIADKYGCSIRELKNWNGLNNSNIKVGQKLVIYKDLKHQEIEEKNNATSYHKVRPGDTLWDIAKKYKGVSVRDLRKLNENLNNESLKPGQKIKINDTG